MKTTRYVMLVLVVLLAANLAQADVPWADSVIHTNPVLPRGLGPEMVTSGYAIVPLSNVDRDGQPVSSYTSWMTGRSGEKVWVKFRPGEPVEAIKTGSRTAERDGCQWVVETWHAKRVVRCGNPTSIDFHVWRKVEVRTVPGPERVIPKPYPVPQPYGIPYPVYRTETRLVYTAQPVWVPTPRSQTYVIEHRGIIGGLLGVGAAYAGRTRISITATGGTANSSAAAAAASSASNTNDITNNNTNVNENNNQLQQQQQQQQQVDVNLDP